MLDKHSVFSAYGWLKFWLHAGKIKKKGSVVSGNWPGKKCLYYILYYIFITFYYIFDLVSEYIPFVTKKRYQKHTETNKKTKETNEEKRHTK